MLNEDLLQKKIALSGGYFSLGNSFFNIHHKLNKMIKNTLNWLILTNE